jgi:hypothetical protein
MSEPTKVEAHVASESPPAELAPEELVPSVPELCKMVLELQKDKDALAMRFGEQEKELKEMHVQRASAAEADLSEKRKKASTMKQSIIEWCLANGIELNEDTREKLEVLSHEHPELGNVAFELTHRASQKYAELEALMKSQKESAETSAQLLAVKQVYNKGLASRGPVSTSAVASVAAASAPALRMSVYEASNKRKFKAPSDVYSEKNAHLLTALKRARGTTTRDAMNRIYSDLKDRF